MTQAFPAIISIQRRWWLLYTKSDSLNKKARFVVQDESFWLTACPLCLLFPFNYYYFNSIPSVQHFTAKQGLLIDFVITKRELMQKGIAKSAAYSHKAAKNCGNAYSVHLWMFVEKGFIPPKRCSLGGILFCFSPGFTSRVSYSWKEKCTTFIIVSINIKVEGFSLPVGIKGRLGGNALHKFVFSTKSHSSLFLSSLPSNFSPWPWS